MLQHAYNACMQQRESSQILLFSLHSSKKSCSLSNEALRDGDTFGGLKRHLFFPFFEHKIKHDIGKMMQWLNQEVAEFTTDDENDVIHGVVCNMM